MISGTKRSEKEYRQLDRLSSSDLRTFATKGRKDFYKRVFLKEIDDDSRSITIGNLTHCLLLEPQEFDNKYYKSTCYSKPTGNMLNFVESLYKHTLLNLDDEGKVTKSFEFLAEEAYKDSGYKRDKLATVLKNFKNSDPERYYKELRQAHSQGKIVVSLEDMNIAEKIVEKLKTHEYTKDIFNKKSPREVQVDDFQIDGLKLKAMIDDLEIDQENKIIIPSDLKVIWSNEDFYENYYLKRRADLQAYVYWMAIKHKYPGYLVNPPRFIVADSTNFNVPLIYHMTYDLLEDAYRGFTVGETFYKGLGQIIEEIKWHISFGIWDVSYENFQNKGNVKIGK